jgi:hypothetical protein
MKKPLIFLSLFLAAVSAHAQGQVNFAARVVGVYDAPVYVCTPVRVEGNQFLVQLYAGPSQSTLVPIGDRLPFRTGADAGYWTAEARTIDRVDATGNAYVQVRAWATSAGATYEAAIAAGYGFGASNIVTVKPTVAPDLPATLVGLTSFSVGPPDCPEPPVITLAVLGCFAFLTLHRRR